VALRRSIALTFASNALSVTLPAGHLVSAGFTFRRLRKWGASTPLVAWTMLASGVISSVALGALGILGATIGVRAHADPITLVGEIAGVLGLVLAFRELVRRPALLVRAGERVLGWVNALLRRPVTSGAERVRALVEQLALVRPRPRDWVLGGMFAGLNWIGDLLCLVAACRAVGVADVGIGLAMTAYVAGMAASSIPLIPGGIGVVDGALIVAFVAGGLGTDEATAAVMLYRLISFALIGAIGWAVLLAARSAGGTKRSRPALRVEGGVRVARGGSGLQAGLDLEGDGDLVADDGAAAFEGHVDGDAEVLAVEDGGGFEAGDRAVAHAGVDAAEFEGEFDGAGDAVEGEVALDHVVVALGADGGGGEGGGGVLLGVEEVGGLDVGVAVGVLGVDGRDLDFGGDGGGAVLGDGDGAGEVVERAADLADHEVADGEADGGVDRVDGPGSGGEVGQGGGGGGHENSSDRRQHS
jgi:uncharacterized protein (TIRG00374 family)